MQPGSTNGALRAASPFARHETEKIIDNLQEQLKEVVQSVIRTRHRASELMGENGVLLAPDFMTLQEQLLTISYSLSDIKKQLVSVVARRYFHNPSDHHKLILACLSEAHPRRLTLKPLQHALEKLGWTQCRSTLKNDLRHLSRLGYIDNCSDRDNPGYGLVGRSIDPVN
jgi:regulator of replication initiation timing